MSGHDHGARECAAGSIIERVNEACAAVGTVQVPGTTTRIMGAQGLAPLVVHTNLTIEEADCLVSNISQGALEVILAMQVLEIEVLRGLVGQAFLAGVFAGKDAAG